ncbi:MAG: hypothetical protein IAE97_00320 [Chthoniobacterales bacterium]|nr:hypothetical protein [Chthoniobacterales bacterium]
MNPIKYIITITKLETRTTKEPGNYTVIDKRPWTQKELSEEGAALYGGLKKFLDDQPLKEVRGYAPDVSITRDVETQVLRQTVESLDLSAVIKAINGL